MRLFILICFTAVSTVSYCQSPANLPSPKTNAYYEVGFMRGDSGFIFPKRDTFNAKFPTVILHNNGNFYSTQGVGSYWNRFGAVTVIDTTTRFGGLKTIYSSYLDSLFFANVISSSVKYSDTIGVNGFATKPYISNFGAANYVSLTGNQTITGVKNFLGTTQFGNNIFIQPSSGIGLFKGVQVGDNYISNINATLLTANRVQQLPDKNGTFAMTSDITALDTITRFGGVKTIYRAYLDSLALATAINAKPTYGDYRSDISDSLKRKPDTIKTKTDSVWIAHYAKMKLKKWQSDVAVLSDLRKSGNTTTSVTPTVIIDGDSVSFDWLYAWFNAIWQALGLGGQYGGFTQNGVTEFLGGGTAKVGLPVLVSSLTSNGSGTATVTSANHGLSNGQTVTISGANNAAYNGVVTVANATTNTFDYTVSGTPPTPDPSSAIYFTRSADFTKWVNGIYTNVPTGGTFTTIRNNNAILLTDTFKTYRIYYIKESGGGTFKVQTSTDNSIYSDVSGYTSISCSSPASDSLGIIEVPITNLLNPYIRIVGVSGNCKIVGTGWQNVQGGRLSNMYAYGGIKMKDQATTPEHIWAAALQADKPDVFVLSFKDDAEPALANAMQTIQTYINRYAPQCATIYSLIYTGVGDSTPATYPAQNVVVRQWFDTTKVGGEKYLFDQYNLLGYYNDAALKGCFDAAAVPTINSITYSAGVATVTTASAHGLSTGNWIRINEVVPYQYNGVFQVTSTGATTFTYVPLSAPSSVGIGGVSARLDGTHVSGAGRQVLGVGFNRDFQLLTGLNTDYPFQISNQNLKATGAILNTGGTMIGTLNGVNQNFTGTSTLATISNTTLNTATVNSTNQIVSTAAGSGSSSGIYVNSTNPAVGLRNSGGGVDSKIWDIAASATTFGIRAINDASNSATNALLFTRSGTAISNISATATTISLTGNTTVTGTLASGAITSSGALSGTTQTLSTSNSSFATQQQITNTSNSANALAGTTYTVNGVNIASVFSTPSNYSNTAQQSTAAYGSSGTNRVALIANANSSGAAQDIYFLTRGDQTTAKIRIFGGGNVAVGTNTDNGIALFQVAGAISSTGNIVGLTTKTSAYTATATDEVILADATSAAFSVTLPTAVGRSGQRYVIKKIDSSVNAVTVATTSSQTIDGSTTYSLATQYKFVTVVSNGSNWMITGNN